jgi:acetyl-CoA carboxylase alpha subunit
MRLETPEIERLLVETHSTVAAVAERTVAMDNKLAGLLVRVDKTNGTVAAVQAEQYKQSGAISMFKYLFALLLSVMTVGAGIAGVVLALVVAR